MMLRTLLIVVVLVVLISGISIIRETFPGVSAQERLRIVVEEVQLPVAAYDAYGHFDPSLTIDDLLVLENGTPQEVRSVRHVPANVVLLLDTGAEINSAKRIRTTREVAKSLVAALDPQDQVSVLQFSNKVDLIQDWTNDFTQVVRALDTKLLSGKGIRLSDALVAAVNQFAALPAGTRHLVMITDGVETPGGKFNRAEALKRVASSNAVVHVISYATVSREAMKDGRRIFRDRDKSTVPDEVVATLPKDPGYEHLRRMHKPGGKTADADPKRIIRVEDYEEAMRAAQPELKFLSDETGGRFWLPESFDEMIADGARTARLVDAGYIITYKPKNLVISAPEGEIRRVQVISRRPGLAVVSRRTYFVAVKSHG